MAKSKHSIALFEVIQANRKTRSGGSALATPKWWFKKRDKANAESAAAKRAESATAVATLPPPPVLVPAALEPQNVDTEPKAPPPPRTAAVDLALDPDRQRISFHFTYTSAAIVAFSAIVCVSLAYIVGHMKQGPAPAFAGPTIEQIKEAPAKPAVMNVGSTPAPSGSAKKISAPPAGLANYFGTEPNKPAAAPAATPLPANADATTSPSGERVHGLNYLIAESWPEEEKQAAYDACDQLNKAGIMCSVEKNVPGYILQGSNATYSVVTLHGYAKISDPNYAATTKAIAAFNGKLGKNSKIKPLNPSGKKW